MPKTTSVISLADLDESQVEALMAQVKERQDAEAEAKKAQREQAKGLAQDIVTLVTTSEVPRQTFQSGAQGWQLGGKDFTSEDGTKYRVSVLIRDEATIPAKEK